MGAPPPPFERPPGYLGQDEMMPGVRLALVALACLGLGGCVPAVARDGAGPAAVDPEGCLAAGGTVVRGLAGESCALPEPDAGNACRQNAECAGFCVAGMDGGAGGTCSPLRPYFGCHSVLVAPGQVVGLCVD